MRKKLPKLHTYLPFGVVQEVSRDDKLARTEHRAIVTKYLQHALYRLESNVIKVTFVRVMMESN